MPKYIFIIWKLVLKKFIQGKKNNPWVMDTAAYRDHTHPRKTMVEIKVGQNRAL